MLRDLIERIRFLISLLKASKEERSLIAIMFLLTFLSLRVITMSEEEFEEIKEELEEFLRGD